MNAMTEIIDGVRAQSRLFTEPPPPKPTAASMAAELDALIDEIHEESLKLRRWENVLILMKSKIENLQTIQRP